MIRLRSANKAFTLLEILVVVVVVGILCVLLTSGLKSSLTKAQGVACASQLKQLGALILQYSAEHNNEFPPSSAYFFREHVGWSGPWYDPSTSDGPDSGGLASYIDSKDLKELVVCPARSPKSSRTEEPPISEGFPYTANYHLLPSAGFQIVRTTSLDKPSSLVLLTDSSLVGGWKFGLNSYIEDLSSFVGSPHADKHSNVLWADGHVTTQTITELKKENLLP